MVLLEKPRPPQTAAGQAQLRSTASWRPRRRGRSLTANAPRLDARTRSQLATAGKLLLPFGVLVYVFRDRPASELAAILIAFFVAEFAALVIHELAHAAMALLLRMQVFAIVIGSGPAVWSGRIGATEVRISPLPLFGFVVAAPLGTRATRMRMLLYAVAGPAANAATAWWLGRGGLSFRPEPIALTQYFLCWVSAMMALFNILPVRLETPLGVLDSDGLRVLRAPRLTDAALDEIRAMPELVQASRINASQGPAEAMAIYDDLRRRFPSSLTVQHDRIVPLIGLNRLEEARDGLRLLLSRTDLNARVALVAKNNLAWTLAALRDPEHAEEAELATRQTLLVAPTLPQFNGTRGAVLVWLGRHADARAFLERALRGATHPAARGSLLLLRAEASARAGDLVAARRDLEDGRAMAPDSWWIRWAEAAVAGMAEKAAS